MKVEPNTKIIGFPEATTSVAPSTCKVCGARKQGGEICSGCQFRLVDLALSSVDDEFPQVVGNPIGNPESEPEPTTFRYAHYEICRTASGEPWELGRGSMGITYKATDTHLGRTVALKIINSRYLASANARDRFLREARAAAQLRHANIASIFHLGLDEDRCFYAMEYIGGETLEGRIVRVGALSCEEALSVVAQAARALRAAHEQHFIHRDIKPTNIMLVDGGHISDSEVAVKLIDFGLVKAVSDEKTGDAIPLGYFAGTPCYASPEQMERGVEDARSDIFSLGMCLWYMLTGKSPAFPTWPVDGKKQLFGDPELFRKFHPPVVGLLEAMVSPDPALRPQTAAAVLELIAKSHPRTADKSGPFSGNSLSRRWRVALAGLALMFLAVILAAGIKFTFMKKNAWSHETDQQVAFLPADIRAIYTQANEAFRKNTKADNQRAINIYLKVNALAPNFAEAHASLAMAYFADAIRFAAPVSQLDHAIASAEHAIALNPKSPDGYQVLAAIRAFQGQPWEALRHLHRALEMDSHSADVMCDFSLLWTAVGEPQLGLPWAIEAARINPSNVRAWHAAAEASVDLCADDQAEEYYGRCVKIMPMWMSGHCGLIHIHILSGNFSRARQDFALAESIHSQTIQTLTLKAQIAFFGGELTEAEAIYRQLLSMHRDGFVSYYSGISYLSALGCLRLRAGDAVEGKALLDEAAQLHLTNSDGPAGVYDLAAVRLLQGRRDDACGLLQQAVSSGWKDYRATRLDPRFADLRGDARFNELLGKLSAHVAIMREAAVTRCAKPISLADYPVKISGK